LRRGLRGAVSIRSIYTNILKLIIIFILKNFRVLIPVLLFLVIGLSSCESSKNISKEESYSPCNDKLYLELQKRDSSTYTDFEKKYFSQKKEECIKYADKSEHDKKQEVGEKIALGMVVAGGVIAAFVLALVVIGFKQ
jgi:hypothetical protein